MDAIVDYACCLLGGVFQSRVEPVAAALDDNPDPATLEAGRRDASARAATIRVRLAELCAGDTAHPPTHADVLATYEVAKSLLNDLWGVLAADARAAGPAAATWAGDAVARAIAAGGQR